MDLRVLRDNTRYAGLRHSAGSVLRDVPITTGRRLVLAGEAEVLPAQPVAAAVVEPEEEKPVAIADMKVAELRSVAGDLGLEVPAKIKRDELVALVEAEVERRAQEGQQPDAGGDNSGNGDDEQPGNDDGVQE